MADPVHRTDWTVPVGDPVTCVPTISSGRSLSHTRYLLPNKLAFSNLNLSGNAYPTVRSKAHP